MRDFLENRPILAGNPTHKGACAPLTHPGLKVAPSATEELPKIELKHDPDGKIREIVVVCRCGERIVLQCAY